MRSRRSTSAATGSPRRALGRDVLLHQGNPSTARQRLELVLKEYPRTLVIPETLFLLAEVNFYEEGGGGQRLLRRLSVDYGYTEWGRRANARLRAQR